MALEQGWYDQARDHFEQALALDASNREAMKGLARVNEILSHKEAAAVEPIQGEPIKLRAEVERKRSIPVSYEGERVLLEAQEERIKVAERERRRVVGIGAAIAIFVLLVGFFRSGDLDSTTARKPILTATARPTRPSEPTVPTPAARQPTTTSTLMSKRETADGYDWWAATEADRIELCKWWDANRRKVMGGPTRWHYVFDGLNEFYRTDEPLILQQKISEIAATLSLLADLE